MNKHQRKVIRLTKCLKSKENDLVSFRSCRVLSRVLYKVFTKIKDKGFYYENKIES